MAKSKSVFVCSECGYESPKWLGKCPACNAWNTFYEEKVQTKSASGANVKLKEKAKPRNLNDVEGKLEVRTSTGISELDRVLGGGIVKGSLVLIGGEPGIGKSTLILQLCDAIAKPEKSILDNDGSGKVLYVSGEESAEQVKMRADRLGIKQCMQKILLQHQVQLVKLEK